MGPRSCLCWPILGQIFRDGTRQAASKKFLVVVLSRLSSLETRLVQAMELSLPGQFTCQGSCWLTWWTWTHGSWDSFSWGTGGKGGGSHGCCSTLTGWYVRTCTTAWGGLALRTLGISSGSGSGVVYQVSLWLSMWPLGMVVVCLTCEGSYSSELVWSTLFWDLHCLWVPISIPTIGERISRDDYIDFFSLLHGELDKWDKEDLDDKDGGGVKKQVNGTWTNWVCLDFLTEFAEGHLLIPILWYYLQGVY